jgi:hypothetical protein
VIFYLTLSLSFAGVAAPPFSCSVSTDSAERGEQRLRAFA